MVVVVQKLSECLSSNGSTARDFCPLVSRKSEDPECRAQEQHGSTLTSK